MDNILANFKRDLEDKGFVHIPCHLYYALLLHFGALPRDLQKIEDGRIHKHVGQDREETMAFRQIAFHRVVLTETDNEAQDEADGEVNSPHVGLYLKPMDNTSNHTLSSIFETDSDSSDDEEKKDGDEEKSASTIPVRGLVRKNSRLSLAGCESVTSLSDTEICSDAGAKVYFERSGPRRWNMPPFEYANSSVPDAIARILDHLQPDMHDDQEGTINIGSNITINDQLLIRVNKAVDENGSTSEPTPEGIHQDATEISSVTLVGRKNVARDRGCESRIWKLDQPTGNYGSHAFGQLDEESGSGLPVLEGFSWDNCLFDKVLQSPWETIIFNDRMVKHEVRGFFAEDESKASYRDVIVNFLRKPLSNGMDERMVNGVMESIL